MQQYDFSPFLGRDSLMARPQKTVFEAISPLFFICIIFKKGLQTFLKRADQVSPSIFYWIRLHTSCWVHNSFHVIKIYLVQLTQGQPQRSLEKVKFWGGISMHKLATDDFKYNLARHKKTSRWNLH